MKITATEIETVDLIPVSEWVYNRYKVEFFHKLGGSRIATLVCTDTHVEGRIQEEMKDAEIEWEYELLEENVRHPPQIGVMYNLIIYHSGWNLKKEEDNEYLRVFPGL